MAAIDQGTADLAAAIVTTPVALADWLVIAPVALPILTGALLLMIRHHVRLHAAIAISGLAASAVCAALLMARVLSGGPLVMTMGRWLPPFGIAFAADTLGALLCLTATLVGLVCALYSLRDIDTIGRRYGFYPFLMLMMAGVGGAFLTGDVFNLYVWFEVFVISSFGLLVVGSDERRIDGAVKYAILNLVATTLFLIATGYLYGVFGTLNMADLHGKVVGRRRSRADHDAGDAVPRCLRHEGRGLPGQFLAAGLLPHAEDRHLGAVRRAADQGRHLWLAAGAGDGHAGRAGSAFWPDRLDRHPDHDRRRRLRAGADRHPPHARLRADLRHRRDAGRDWRSATPPGSPAPSSTPSIRCW